MSTPVEIEATLAAKLDETLQEKSRLYEKISNFEVKIRNGINQLSKRPSDSEAHLTKKIAELEYHHTTTSYNSEQERNYVRTIAKLKEQLKSWTGFKKIQEDIDAWRAERDQLKTNVRSMEDYVTAIRQGLRRVRLAIRIGCSYDELEEQNYSVTDECISRISGKGAAGLKQLEKDHGVSIETDRLDDNIIHILGLPQNIPAVVTEIIKIISTSTESIDVKEETCICLIMDRAKLIEEMQTLYNVRIDVSRKNFNCKITGFTDSVESAKTAIAAIDSACIEFKVDPTSIPSIIGKDGSTIRSLGDTHRVQIDLSREDNRIRILGFRSGVEKTADIIRQIVDESREIEEIIKTDKHTMIGCIIGTNGDTIRRLQKEFGIFMQYEKSSESGALEALTLKGAASRVQAAKRSILDLIRAYEDNTDVIEVPADIMPILVGKKGARIQSIRNDHKSIIIDVDKLVVKISGEDFLSRQKAKNAVLDIIVSNYSRSTVCNEDESILLRSAKAAEIRNRLQNDLGVSLDIETDRVDIRGRKREVDLGMDIVEAFFKQNKSIHIKISDEDRVLLRSNPSNNNNNKNAENKNAENDKDKSKDKSKDKNEKSNSVAIDENSPDVKILYPIRYMESNFDVEVYWNNKSDNITIRGHPSSVANAEKFFHGVMKGDMSCGSFLMPVNPSMFSALIGKGGANLQKMESELGVKFDLLKSRNLLRIRGVPIRVKNAEIAVLDFLDDTRININMDQSSVPSVNRDVLRGVITDCEKIFDAEIILDNNHNNLTIKSSALNAERCKNYITERLTDKSRTVVHLTEGQCQYLERRITKLFKELRETHSEVSIEVNLTENTLVLSGPVKDVNAVKREVFTTLQKSFSSQFTAFFVSSLFFKLFFPPKEVRKIRVESGASVEVDMPATLVFVQGDATAVLIASNLIQRKWDEFCQHYSEIDFDDKLLPQILGRGGATIQAMEKASSASITVNRDASKLELYCKDASALHGAVEYVTNEIVKIRSQYFEVIIDASIAGVFVGKQGANIKKFRDELGAKLDFEMASRKLVITGTAEQVLAAKNRILPYLEEELRNNFTTTMYVPLEGFPILIGTKGENIKQVQKETNVRVDFSESQESATIRGSEENCAQAVTMLRQKLEENNLSTVRPVVVPKPQPVSIASTVVNNNSKIFGRVPVGATPAMLKQSQEKMLSKSALKRLRKKEKALEENNEDEENEEEEEEKTAPAPVPAPAPAPVHVPVPTSVSNAKSASKVVEDDEDDNAPYIDKSLVATAASSISSAPAASISSGKASVASIQLMSSATAPSNAAAVNPVDILLGNISQMKLKEDAKPIVTLTPSKGSTSGMAPMQPVPQPPMMLQSTGDNSSNKLLDMLLGQHLGTAVTAPKRDVPAPPPGLSTPFSNSTSNNQQTSSFQLPSFDPIVALSGSYYSNNVSSSSASALPGIPTFQRPYAPVQPLVPVTQASFKSMQSPPGLSKSNPIASLSTQGKAPMPPQQHHQAQPANGSRQSASGHQQLQQQQQQHGGQKKGGFHGKF